jgi:hypothetical protein
MVQSEWDYVLGLLPRDLARSAWAHGVILRRRQVQSAAALLRLVLGYALCDWSLRATAAAAERMGFGRLSDVAVLKRLRRCGPWLARVTAQVLARQQGPLDAVPGLRMRLVDATTISRPGSRGADWRIHAGYDAARGCFDELVLTDVHGGETLRRYPLQSGDVLVADRGYAHAEALGAASAAGAAVVVRLPWNALAFHTDDGELWDLFAFLRQLPAAQAGEAAVHVTLAGACLPARVVAVRKSAPATEVARRRILREAHRKGKEPDPRTLECAAYFFVLTTLPPAVTAPQVLAIYRVRWQIEMAFKRLKSVLHIDALRAKDPELARTYLYGKLLGALLLDEFTARAQVFSPWGFPLLEPGELQRLAGAPSGAGGTV